MWRSFGVGMSGAIDLAKTEPEPPQAAKRKQSCYVTLGLASGPSSFFNRQKYF
jgi:hypothetical protein